MNIYTMLKIIHHIKFAFSNYFEGDGFVCGVVEYCVLGGSISEAGLGLGTFSPPWILSH